VRNSSNGRGGTPQADERNLMSGLRGRLVDVGGVIYDYDGDGFLKKKTDGSDVTEYAYSSRGELLNVTLPGGRAVAYVHDPLGRRIAKKVGGTVVEKYLWQGLTRLLAVFDGNNALIMRFEYADARMPVAMTKAGTTYYLGYDQAGSLKAVADASGNVIKKIEYDSFGNIINGTNPNFAVPFGFAGGLYDRDTGLVRFGYRDYDPETGRWTAKDPILFAGGDTDLYGYCLNDPVNLNDPAGLFSVTGCGDEESRIRSEVIRACGNLDSVISDPELRECIRERCDKAEIRCEEPAACDGDECAYTSCFLSVFCSSGVHLCTDNPSPACKKYGEIAVHEWAHSCGWDHGDGKGVPGDTGKIK